jgi:4-amino-4-deoxy-L-arabinose transferase-like glycosyltransferase
MIGLLFFFYGVTRIGSLEALPMFLDEAVHIQWAERLYGEGRIQRPVASGRLLAVAAYGLALPFDDRLFAARVIAVLAGGVTLAFILALSRRLFGTLASFLTGLLYLLSPFALAYDRLALSDGFLSACVTALMFAACELARSPESVRWRLAAAVLLALAVVSKVSAFLFVVTLPLGAFLLATDRRLALRAAIQATGLGLLLASPMLWFFASSGGEISAQHIVEPGAIALDVIGTTLRDMGGWLECYFTWPALLAAGFSLVLLGDRRAFWLAASAALPFILFALFSQPWSARYVLPVLPPFLLLAGGGLERVSSRAGSGAHHVGLLLTLLVSAASLPFTMDLLRNPARAGFPPDDRLQLVTGWPSGYGVRELSERLRKEASLRSITVYVDLGGPRTVPTSLAVLLGREPRISLVEMDFDSAAFRTAIGSQAAGGAFAVATPRAAGFDFASLVSSGLADRIELYVRPGGEWAATLFRMHPSQ